jgi:hypothetical protein
MEGLALVVVLIAICWGVRWFTNPRRDTGRRGSRYYVPRFRASFEAWEPRWDTTRRWYSNREKDDWQKEFDQLLK